MAGKLFVISAPSGTGKSTLVDALLASWNMAASLKRVVTYTTRLPRSGEVEGKDYHYITVADFKLKQESGFFRETNEFCGNWYGSPACVFDASYRGETSFIFVIDQEGARALKHTPGTVLIWIMPPTIEELECRLQKRGKDFAQFMEQRLQKAHAELEREKHDRIYDYHLINDDFLQTASELKHLIEAEIGNKNDLGN